MVIIGLLLIALACLVLGLATQSAVWLVASLVATGGAGVLLYKLRDVIGTPKRGAPAQGFRPGEPARPAVAARPTSAASPPTTEPAAGGPDDIPADSTGLDDDVWVVDGRPRYHLSDCEIIKGHDAEPIAFEQATEDGFMPCSLCEPNAARTH
jgi:hypothetical protein